MGLRVHSEPLTMAKILDGQGRMRIVETPKLQEGHPNVFILPSSWLFGRRPALSHKRRFIARTVRISLSQLGGCQMWIWGSLINANINDAPGPCPGLAPDTLQRILRLSVNNERFHVISGITLCPGVMSLEARSYREKLLCILLNLTQLSLTRLPITRKRTSPNAQERSQCQDLRTR